MLRIVLTHGSSEPGYHETPSHFAARLSCISSTIAWQIVYHGDEDAFAIAIATCLLWLKGERIICCLSSFSWARDPDCLGNIDGSSRQEPCLSVVYMIETRPYYRESRLRLLVASSREPNKRSGPAWSV